MDLEQAMRSRYGRAGRAEVLAGPLLLAGLTLVAEATLAVAKKRLIPVGVRGESSVVAVAVKAGRPGSYFTLKKSRHRFDRIWLFRVL
jgi:hypothetical protein